MASERTELKLSCVLCDKEMETRTDDVFVTVNWILKDILQKNHVQCDKDLPRVLLVCKTCWNSLKDKPQRDNYYWLYNKTI